MKKYHIVMGAMLVGSLLVGGMQSSAFAQAPAPATPAAPSKAPAMAPAAGSTSTAGEIHANKKSKVYHLSTCPGYAKVSGKNLMTFATEDEAMKAGYHKAKNCK